MYLTVQLDMFSLYTYYILKKHMEIDIYIFVYVGCYTKSNVTCAHI